MDEKPFNLEPYYFQCLLRQSSDFIYFKDKDCRFLLINENLAKCLKLKKPEEALGKTDFDFYDDDHARIAFADEQRIIRTGNPIVDVHEEVIWPDGRVTWVSSSKYPLLKDGETIGTFGISRDITEHKLALAALDHSHKMIQSHHQSLDADLLEARAVQVNLMSRDFPEFENLHIEISEKPASLISGDFFKIHSFSDKSFGIFMGDIMGHGMSAALFTSLLGFLVEQLCQKCGSEPDQLIRLLNENLRDHLHGSFVTAVYGFFEKQEDCWSGAIVNSGHPQPLVSHTDGTVRLLNTSKAPALGILDEITLKTSEFKFQPGERILLYSDGATEATSPKGEMLGTDGLRDLFKKATSSSGSITHQLMNELETFRNEDEDKDDIILACLRFD